MDYASHLLKLGVQKLQSGSNEEAITALKQSLVLAEDWRTYQFLGIALGRAKQYQSAISLFQKSIAIKDHWQSYYGLGVALLHLMQNKSAADAFNKSLTLKQTWESYQGLGTSLHKMGQYQLAVDAFKNSLVLNDHWQSHQGIGMALLNMKQYQLAVDALKKSIKLQEDWETSRTLGEAFLRLGKEEEAANAMQNYFRNNINQYQPKIDPCLAEKEGVSITQEEIRRIANDISKLDYAFHPSFFTGAKNNQLLQSWEHLIHIHIPKCAGTNFDAPIRALPEQILNQSSDLKRSYDSHSQCNHYFWYGGLAIKFIHDAYVRETFKNAKSSSIQGSFLSTCGSKHGIYDQELKKRGVSAKKICIVRDPSKRLYSHIRHNGRISKDYQELLQRCVNDGPNLMDRYIYDYDLFYGRKEVPYCQPFDYEHCDSIDFIDIADNDSITKIKSSFLTATLMPNIVQCNRLNDDKGKNHNNALNENNFQEVFKELISRGYIDRDNQIDLEYLKNKTQQRLQFPEIIFTGECLHPITFIYPKTGTPRLMLTQDFIDDPLRAIDN